MKAQLVLVLCGFLAACSQTASTTDVSDATPAHTRKASATAPKSRQEACEKAIRDQANAGMVSSALGMVGGFGGFGGRGGAMAAHVAASAGSMVANAHQQQAQSAVMRDCGAYAG